MRILITTHYVLPHRGGIEVLVAELTRRWSEQGHGVCHQTSRIGTPRRPNNDSIGPVATYLVSALNCLERFAIPYPLFDPLQLHRLLDELIRDVDVVNVQGMLYMNSVIAAQLAHKRGIPVVLSEYPGFVQYGSRLVNLVERFAFETIGRYCARRSDAAVVINDRVASFIRRYVRAGTPIEQINVGVDTSRFRPATNDQRRKLREKWKLHKPAVLFAGRLVPRKGIAHLRDLSSDQYELIVCGRGEARIDHPNIRFLGFVSDADLLELFQATDLFLLLTDGDDFPLVGLETMACGLPVIAFDTPANREYHDESSAVFAGRSIPQVLESIQRLAGDESRRQAMGLAARERAVSLYDWSITADRYLDLFARLIEHR